MILDSRRNSAIEIVMDAHSIALPGTFPDFCVDDLTFSTKQQRDRSPCSIKLIMSWISSPLLGLEIQLDYYHRRRSQLESDRP
ncbi:MAG: hypothetical protein WBA43_02590 [Elainellaceae cyanobacterium]